MRQLYILVLLLFSCSDSSSSSSFSIENIQQLTFTGDNGEGYLNEEETQIIFQSKRDSNECDKLYLVDIDGKNLREFPIKDGAFTCAHYALENEFIFFSSTMKDGPECPEIYKHPNPRKYIWPLRNYEIYKWDGNTATQLTNAPGYNAETTIHPTERKVIFTSMREGDIDLYEMDYDGNNVKRITKEFGYDGGAFYSPDGNSIIWRAWYPSNDEEKEKWSTNLSNRYIDAVPLDIYMAKRDGSNKKRLTNNGATNWSPSWHPDGKHIVFSSNMDDWREDYNAFGSNFELYMIHVDTLKLQRLTNNDTFDSFPVISQNGKIIFSSNRNAENPRQTNIFIGSIVNK
jgi:Tol biopolymer transport system component